MQAPTIATSSGSSAQPNPNSQQQEKRAQVNTVLQANLKQDSADAIDLGGGETGGSAAFKISSTKGSYQEASMGSGSEQSSAAAARLTNIGIADRSGLAMDSMNNPVAALTPLLSAGSCSEQGTGGEEQSIVAPKKPPLVVPKLQLGKVGESSASAQSGSVSLVSQTARPLASGSGSGFGVDSDAGSSTSSALASQAHNAKLLAGSGAAYSQTARGAGEKDPLKRLTADIERASLSGPSSEGSRGVSMAESDDGAWAAVQADNLGPIPDFSERPTTRRSRLRSRGGADDGSESSRPSSAIETGLGGFGFDPPSEGDNSAFAGSIAPLNGGQIIPITITTDKVPAAAGLRKNSVPAQPLALDTPSSASSSIQQRRRELGGDKTRTTQLPGLGTSAVSVQAPQEPQPSTSTMAGGRRGRNISGISGDHGTLDSQLKRNIGGGGAVEHARPTRLGVAVASGNPLTSRGMPTASPSGSPIKIPPLSAR